MPLPKPGDGQNKDDFLSACMVDGTMTDEYPDEKQRYAICNSIWDEEKKEKPMKKEKRTFQMEEFRAVAEEEDKTPYITGYAAVFNKWSEDLGGFKEKIAQGAFRKTLQSADVRALFNHDPNYVLGRTSSNTLELEENNKGLRVKIVPPGTQWANDLLVSINRGDVNQMSFGFRVIDDDWEDKPSGIQRTIREVELFDVSAVTFPAYPQTSVQLRDMLHSEGIDLDALTRLLIRHEREMSLHPEDVEFLQKTISFLGNILEPKLEDSDPEVLEDGRGQEEARLQLLKRRIELARLREMC